MSQSQITLLTREQAERIARECAEWPAADAQIIGEGGDVLIVLMDNDGARLESFTLDPDGNLI